MRIEIKSLSNYYTYENLPAYQTPGAAGIDLVSPHGLSLSPGGRMKISTGLAVWIRDKSVVGLIYPRSSLGSKGIIISNCVGVLDSDYQKEIFVSLWNTTKKRYYVEAGDRVAQLVFTPVIRARWDQVEEFTGGADRGHSGSTGK